MAGDDFETVSSAFADLFGEMFGGKQSGRGRDLRVELELDLAEIADGCVRDIQVRRGKLCTTCTGTGHEPGTRLSGCKTCEGQGKLKQKNGFFESVTVCSACLGRGTNGTACDDCMGMGTQPALETLAVTVPAGVADGATLRLVDRGDELRDGANGHLYVAITAKSHAHFTRRDADVLVEVVVPNEIAEHGGKLAVPSLHGERTVDIPAGTRDRDELVVRGCGMQIFGKPATPMPVATVDDAPYRSLDLSGRGNLVVTLRVHERGAKGWLKRFFKTDRL